MNAKRAPFSEDLKPLRNFFPELIQILEADSSHYGSLYFERKTIQNAGVDLKRTQSTDDIVMGVVLRIYNGETLFEQATDDLDFQNLKAVAHRLRERVSHSKGGEPYTPSSWKDRLKETLEDDIVSQVPKGVRPQTEVHFGVRYQTDPTDGDVWGRLRVLKDRVLKETSRQNLERSQLSYLALRQSFAIEESLFVDREVNLSQKLYRIALMAVLMSGPERTFLRIGGLGGLEAIELSDLQIQNLVTDLIALREFERLEPGKYRVLFSPPLTGVLAHEAFGHSQEGDTCARGRSKAWDLYHSGERVGNEHATILNNPAIFENGTDSFAAWGSYFFDEEGWFSKEQTLLNQGRLQQPMTNLTSAIRLGVPRSANGKRENWSHGVYTRQTNTYFSAGEETYESLLQKIDDGFIATHAAGGMEDPKGMGIQVGIAYLKEVKKGRLTGRVFKGPAGGDIQMTGYVPEVLNSIIGKSKIAYESSKPDASRHPENDVGGCGKYHKELVYAGCGGPWMLMDNITLG